MKNKNLLPVILFLTILMFFVQIMSANVGLIVSAQEDETPILRDSGLTAELVSASLKDPTSMTFIGPNDILVTEKNTGTVQRVINGKLLGEPLLDVNVNGEDERGLLGIAASKNVNPKLLLDLPYLPGPAHNGGAITIGPDNNVYLAVGELTPTSYGQGDYRFKVQNYEDGQEPDGRAGILRISQDGDTVQGIIGNNYPENIYYAYGIRNSFGIGFDPLTQKLWDTENGPSFGDEINIVEPGFNSGWAKVLGIWKVEEVINDEGDREILKGEAIPENISGSLFSFNGSGRYSSPELSWDQTIAPTSVAFLNSSKIGTQYENDMFVGTAKDVLLHFDLDGKNRSELLLNGSLADKVADSTDELDDATFAENLGIITDLDVGPDGNLYVLTGVRETEGKIYRIVPSIT